MFNFGPICVALTILFTVYGQLILKWQLSGLTLPEGWVEKVTFLLKQLLNPWIFSGFAAAFLASLCWMAAMTRLKLSVAYPYTSLSLVLVLVMSHFLFGEVVTPSKIFGTFLIVAGLIILGR